MRTLAVLFISTLIVCGCSGNPTVPSPDCGDKNDSALARATLRENPHYLWGQWNFYFNSAHDRVDVVPQRDMHLHMNTLKFLEEYCTDCLEITGITNNWDGTINLTVRIIHPFADNPEYTGFDVKGIIMFKGSHEVRCASSYHYPWGEYSDPSYFYVSWSELGDPEVLNPDGYSVLWTPWWDSGSDLPIFNYWTGKYSKGSPSANINAFLNFYTDEERHMFRVDGHVERTYHISLPPGPVAAGYAIDACWVPPVTTPVTDPLNDFPESANQEESYYFRLVVNNDEPITQEPCCGVDWDCSDFRVEYAKWRGETPHCISIYLPPYDEWIPIVYGGLPECDCNAPPGVHCLTPNPMVVTSVYEIDGLYRGVAVLWHGNAPLPPDSISYCVFDYIIDLE